MLPIKVTSDEDEKVNIDSLTLIHSFIDSKQQDKWDTVQNPHVTWNRDLCFFI